MDRRTLLKSGSMAALGLGFGGCAVRTSQPAIVTRRLTRPPIVLAPIRASWDRVIRTTVGLRPHRPSGFVVKAEKFDAKTVVHNYGHGGAGISLSWGTGALAADLALEQSDRRAAVLGSGAVGLAAARQLQRRGFEVTIYAMAVPPETTSNMAYATFSPTSRLVSGPRTAAWEAQFDSAVEIAYRQLQLLVGPRYGISWLDSYSTMEALPSTESAEERVADGVVDDPEDRDGDARLDVVSDTYSAALPTYLRSDREILYPGEHPFQTPYASRRSSMRIEPSIYLDALVGEFHLLGGRIVIRQFDTPRDLMSVSESVIVNCTGLGSRDLFSDEELIPVKGQLTFLVPQPEINYEFNCMPRSDGIALGSTGEWGVWTLEPNEEARRRIVERAIERYARMRPPEPGMRLTQSRLKSFNET
ncbi:MAG: FAD-dependent oxidoreductase [Acidobacteria bacterium]|nr:FAD-dependent oxidoreductase [Acidobacteriota bacterium]